MLVNIPAVGHIIGSWAADALSEQTGTPVSIGKIDFGLLNRIIIDDIIILDQQHRPVLKADRMAAKIDIIPLLQGKISISNIQLFGLNASLSRSNPDAKPNYQFLIDAFTSTDTDEAKSPIDLRIGAFIMRRGHITYDVQSEPTQPTINPNHLDINNINATFALKALTNDTLNLTIKRLDMTEQNSRLRLNALQAHIAANQHIADITGLLVKLSQSEATADTISIQYENYQQDHTFAFDIQQITANILPTDLTPFISKTITSGTPLHLSAALHGNQDELFVEQIQAETPNRQIALSMQGTVQGWQNQSPDFSAITNLYIDNEGKQILTDILNEGNPLPQMLTNIGTVNYAGNVNKYADVINTDGELVSDIGTMDINLTLDDKNLYGTLSTTQLDLATLASDDQLGNVAFNVNVDGNLDKDNKPTGTISGEISSIEYKQHEYNNIKLTATRQDGTILAHADIDDDLLTLDFDGSYTEHESRLNGLLNIHGMNPHALNLTEKYADETIDLTCTTNLQGTDINNIVGNIQFNTINITTPERTFSLDNTSLNILQADNKKQIDIHSDFADIHLDGSIQVDGIADAFLNQVSHHLPALIHHQGNSLNQFDFEADITEHEFWHHYINTDYVLDEPVHIAGHIDAQADTMYMAVKAQLISNGERKYRNTNITATNSNRMLSLSGSTNLTSSDYDTKILITADANNNQLQTLLNWDEQLEGKSNGMIYATTEFSDSLGQMKTAINLHRSQITINDSIWHVNPSSVSIYGKTIACNNVKLYNDNRYILVNGMVSDNPADSIVADLNDLEVAYITELVDFHAVRFRGEASGRAVISNVYKDLYLNADLVVNDMQLQEGRLGVGHIQAYWDKDIEGININGHITDHYKGLDRTTDVSGFVAPGRNDMDLKVSTYNTNAEFLNGFLSSTFSDINGRTNGELHIIGPLNDVNIVGDVSADVDMTLRATNVTYHINPSDSIHMRHYGFDFNNVRLSDKKSGTAIVKGTLAHKNMKNFKYDFDISMDDLTIYDEQEFNSDKFYATVFADGSLAIHGSDGHPLYMSADVTPTRGSVFAYDAATPDAITSSSFVVFRDVTPTTGSDVQHETEANPSVAATQQYEYQGDIFMDISLHVNPDCEIKLRMDNVEDGYMTTYGSGTLLAHYHNKSPFSLNGIYQIQGGRYRLYLQDIIFRDLDIQSGSNVVFNGNPFDANIHLICHHTIQSVPLRDLTLTNAFNQNSKVKVICVMDISGKLDNMNFAFDLQLPNVSDETRQLVKSLITSDEEMNMQMIYLLGLGRFYSNEYARATGESGSSQAVNTLLSSTLSGQVNQMLSNVIGQDSKWNFGTGLSTGERGWNDLDVEGILSGRLLNDRLLINGNFGYRDNALTNSSNFIGDFDVRWRLSETGHTYIKAYNQTNDRYFTKATLNTQGIGLTYQRDFDSWKALLRRKVKEESEKGDDNNQQQ